jgi:hypothetical protein
VFVIFGGRELARRAERVTISGEDYQEIHRDQVLTLLGLLVLAVGAVGFDLEIGFLALAVAAVLALVALIPLAVPVIETGGIGAVALIVALSISSSVGRLEPVLDVGRPRGRQHG